MREYVYLLSWSMVKEVMSYAFFLSDEKGPSEALTWREKYSRCPVCV